MNGTYHDALCDPCYVSMQQSVSSGEADYNRQRDLEDHLGDIQQPYIGGEPNPAFIELYPDKAREMWSENQLRDANR